MSDCTDPKTNGEEVYFSTIKDDVSVVFDVGCRSDSVFTQFEGEVHYFDPVHSFIQTLSTQPTKNTTSVFNAFGLGSETSHSYYYPKYESFYDRVRSCGVSDDPNKVLLSVRRGDEYMDEKSISSVDFLKIDTEGFELSVLKGFGEKLKSIKFIQFEYGGTFLDNGLKLIDVVDYLIQFGFHEFSYLSSTGTVPITDFTDHYNYCNIVCKNSTHGCPSG